MKDFQLHVPPGYPRNFAPATQELDIGALPVDGAVPRGLRGTLLRNGPNPRTPQAAAHWFAGDGMLHAFRFDGGRVSYRNRWIRTPRWCAPAGAASSAEGGSVANTNVLVHAGQLLALEEAHLPLRLDGLAADGPVGPPDFAASLAGPFTAHPKIDPATGDMIFFGYGVPDAWSPGMSYGSLDAAGRVTRFERFCAPYASMVHDFAVTAQHVLFPVLPLAASAARAAAGGPTFAWEPHRGGYVGILRRDRGVESLAWRAVPPCFVFHVMNAWDDGRRIEVDVMQSDVPALFTWPDGSAIDGDSDAYLARWTIDLDAAAPCHSQEFLCDIPGEFPRIDDRFAGSAHRHAWFVGDGAQGQPFACLVHIDHHEGRLDVHHLPAGDCASEGVFVPRAGHAGEGEGWLLSVVYRGRADRSDLLVFDAQALGAGPVACVRMPCRIPNGLHGNWVDAAAGAAWHAW
ncbi:carotenoid oxygenase family protein [Aquincola sp. MAHUQ-54]|uniref:Carotenoid oxygenase family protein n=1 Tax=Aquincola agrisoli TaxID=3119538 RepID=A0AAW9QEA2_9BURK